MPDLTCLNFQITDRIARLELSSPPLNILTRTMLGEIRQALESIADEPGICAVLLTAAAESRAFSVGIEISEYRGATAYQMLMDFHDIFRLLDEIGKPVVAAVDGAALGGGCELVAFADLVIATERATFALPEIRVGLFPPFAAVFLPQVIGHKRAAEMMMTGAQVSARTAAAWGLAGHVVAPEQLAASTEDLLSGLRAMSAAALELTRRALHLNATLDFHAALARIEKLWLEQAMSLDDAAEGLAALVEKRRPVWKDR